MAITKTSDGNTIEKSRDPVPMLSIEKKNRKNCECCPSQYLIVNH